MALFSLFRARASAGRPRPLRPVVLAGDKLGEKRVQQLLDPKVDDVKAYLDQIRIWSMVRLVEKKRGRALEAKSREGVVFF